ncbi:MAG: ATP-binding protein [Thioalkalispiraceae bacterium]|jgi:signal transduction histidine kinase/CheY-like chemotaxis protein
MIQPDIAIHNKLSEAETESLADRLFALHSIISRPDLSFDKQIDECLRLGCMYLGTEIGKLGRQDPENNISEFLNTVVLSDLPIKRGMIMPLDKTFCNVTFSTPGVISISKVDESDYKDHPAAAFLGVQSYIAISIDVHGKKFGTVNFANREPVEKHFSALDEEFVRLLGSWISVMMERQIETEELRKSKEAAERANQAKTAFLANMSHEIRTPLTTIIGFSDTALDEDQTEEQRVNALKVIRDSGNHLFNLINEILDFSKIEAGELDIEKSEVVLNSLVSEVDSIASGLAKSKNLNFQVEFEYPLPAKIISDALRLKQVLLNLCSNAIKFTESGEVRVVVCFDSTTNELKFIVRDSGIGMTPQQIKHIFKPFKQADSSTSRRFGGTGLGLSLSAKLAGLLGGKLLVESEPGQGSEFQFILELSNSDVGQVVLKESESKVAVNKKQTEENMPALMGSVLLVDDSEMNQQLLGAYLTKMGVELTIADNGESAVSLAQQNNFDLIYMDMQMPVMSGEDAVRKLRELNYTKPIIMLTANATLDDRNLCKEAGSDDFLTKPVTRQKLYEVTARYLRCAD